MSDADQVGAVDDDKVRFKLNGNETHGLYVAEQLSRDVDAAIETLRSDQARTPTTATTTCAQ